MIEQLDKRDTKDVQPSVHEGGGGGGMDEDARLMMIRLVESAKRIGRGGGDRCDRMQKKKMYSRPLLLLL